MSEFDYEIGSAQEPHSDLHGLLTDALRAGPGSPQWVEALKRLHAAPSSELAEAEVQEHELLMAARERLHQIRNVRSLRPSAELSEKILAAVAAEAHAETKAASRHGLRGWSGLTLFAAAAMAIISVASLVIEMYGLPDSRPAQVLHLRTGPNGPGWQVFESILPDGWRMTGPLRVKSEHGLQLADGVKQIEQSGGLLRVAPLVPTKPLDLQANIRYVGGADIIPEVFLTDEETLDEGGAGDHGHEFVWTMVDDQPGIRLPNHIFTATDETISPGKAVAMNVRMKVMNGRATVVTNGVVHKEKECTWTGMTFLSHEKPWRFGVRFVIRGTQHEEAVAFDSVRVYQK